MVRFFGKSDVEIIEAIHNDFDTAQERLLQDAKKVLNSLPNVEIKNEDLAKRLSKYGFVNSAQVNEVKKLQDQKAEIEKTRGLKQGEAELVLHYKETYPFMKFLTVEELDRLCEKWDLIHASVDHYKEAIPIKNLEDIERAQKLLDVDKLNTKFQLQSKFNSYRSEFQNLLHAIGIHNYTITQKEVDALCIKYNGRIPDGWDKVVGGNGMWLWSAMNRIIETSVGQLTSTASADFERMHTIRRATERMYSSQYDAVQVGESSDQLFIAAPKSHFNLDGLEKVGKYGFRKIFKMPEPKDPIVFRYVRGGIQVITKWGLEASDPMLINSIDN